MRHTTRPQKFSRHIKLISVAILALLIPAVLIFLPSSSAQDSSRQTQPAQKDDTGPISSQAVGFAETKPLGEIAKRAHKKISRQEAREFQEEANREAAENRMIKHPTAEAVQRASVPGGLKIDGAIQTEAPGLNMPAPTGSFDGLSNQDNANFYGGRITPPDTDGAVGPNHYVQQINILARIWDKSGTPLTPPFKLSSLFSALGGQCAAQDAGDPIVLYDPLADRWMLSQFAFASQTAPPYHQCIAISKTPDPTGAYFAYDFITAGNEFPDYPKLGVWPDGYYMMVHQFTNGGPFNGSGVYSFDRVKMVAGNPTASYIYFNLNLASHPEGVGGLLPSNMNGVTPPPVGRPNTFAYFTAIDQGDPANGLRLFDFHSDFAIPANSTFVERTETTLAAPLAVAAFSVVTPVNGATGRSWGVPQPAPANLVSASLDPITDRLMHSMQYRNQGGYETLVMTHNVGAPASATFGTFRAAPRYYELRSTGGGAFVVQEQATFAPGGSPGDNISRWMGSAAEDNQGNLAVGYSVSSGAAGGNVFPGVRYAGRLAGDAPNQLAQGEATMVNGTGVQTDTANNRWGDYSGMSMDPVDDCTFWYTQMYYTAASQATSAVGFVTRIGSFKFPSCTAPAKGIVHFTVTDCATNALIPGASISIDSISYGATIPDGTYDVFLTPGAHTYSITKAGYTLATGNFNIINSEVTNVPVCLNGAAQLAISKTADNSYVVAGSSVGFVVTLTNNGAATATGIAVTDSLPGGASTNWSVDVPNSDAGWSVTGAPPTQSLVYSPTTLAAGTSTHVHVVSSTSGVCAGAVLLSNTASFTSTNDGSGNASASVNVLCPPVAAGPVTVTATIGTLGPTNYATVQLAFAAINAGTHRGVINVWVLGNTTETVAAVLNASGSGASSYTSILMLPSGTRTVSGAIAASSPLIDLNGADNVTINGLNTGGNALTISNTGTGTTAGTSTIRFIADASNNTVTNCSILGSSASTFATAAGTILFSTGTTTGNDNDTISNNSIGPAGANLPSKAIMASGTSAAIENDNALITGNNIFDFFLATSATGTSGMNVLTGNEAWTISNNRFYQTATRTFTIAATRYSAITLNNSTGGFTVSGNTIGFGAANGTGTTTITGSSNEVRGIDAASVRTTAPATSITGNTISGINQTTSRASTTTSASAFIAVAMGTTDGLLNATGNTIGSLDGSSTIVINSTSVTANTAAVIGFYNFSFFDTNISSNNIGAITIQSTGTTVGFRGILVNTNTGRTATINNNTIGGAVAGGAITDTQVGSYAMYGIQSALPNVSATGNTIRNLSGNSNGAALIISSGIVVSGSTGGNTISGNTIHSLSNASGAASNSIYAISCSFPATANVVERNFIHSLSMTSTVTTGQLVGIISSNAASTATYKNNMVRLGLNAAGTSVTPGFFIAGLWDAAGTNNFYFNSSYVGGSGVVSASSTFAFFSQVVTNARSYRDNIFWNARSNTSGTGKNYAIAVAGTTPNPAGLTSNYNDLFATGTGGFVGLFNAVDRTTLANWQTATGQDANSVSVDPLFVNPTGTSVTGDLHIQPTSPVINIGQAILGVTNDFDNDARGSAPDIGADEIPVCGNNVAAASNGAVATASSQVSAAYPATGVNNGEHNGYDWGAGGGWNDGTATAFPDTVTINLGVSQSINEIDVYTLKDDWYALTPVNDSTTFTQFGITNFQVQYWNGAAFVDIPGGNVTGNNLVKRKFNFPSITTDRIQVVVNASADAYYSRVVEIEAYSCTPQVAPTPTPTPTPVPSPTPNPCAIPADNVALASNGSTAVASSTANANFPAAGVINGEHNGNDWGSLGGWNDNTPAAFPDNVEVDFNVSQTINEIDVYTLKDDFNSGSTVTDTTTFASYGITNFNVQYWTGAAWADVPGGAVTGNNLVKRKFLFTPIATDKIRVLVSNSADSYYSRVVEIEAFSCTPVVAPTPTPTPTPCDLPANNVALASNGGSAVASSTANASFPAGGAIDGEHNGNTWGAGGGWNDGTSTVFPDNIQVNFSVSQTINQIDVYTLKDDFNSGSTVNDLTTFTSYGITSFNVQYWTGAAWADVPGGAVTSNSLVKRKFIFPDITTDRIRVVVNNSADSDYSRVVEIEAFSCTPLRGTSKLAPRGAVAAPRVAPEVERGARVVPPGKPQVPQVASEVPLPAVDIKRSRP